MTCTTVYILYIHIYNIHKEPVQTPACRRSKLQWQVTPFSSLTSPAQLCGLAERCVGATGWLGKWTIWRLVVGGAWWAVGAGRWMMGYLKQDDFGG